MFGSVDKIGSYGYWFQINKTTTANQFRLIVQNGDVFWTRSDYNQYHTYDLIGRDLYIDNVLCTTGHKPYSSEQLSANLALFARTNNTTSSIEQYGKWGIKSCKIYTDGINISRDFKPCIRISDNEIGLYDTISMNFYTNSGSGQFIYE